MLMINDIMIKIVYKNLKKNKNKNKWIISVSEVVFKKLSILVFRFDKIFLLFFY